MDVALNLHKIMPGAKYEGSLTDNTKASFDALRWLDARPKPSWKNVQDAEAVTFKPEKSEVEILRAALKAKGLVTDADILIEVNK